MKSKFDGKRINKRLLRLLQRRQDEKVAKAKTSGYLFAVSPAATAWLFLLVFCFQPMVFGQQTDGKMTVRVKDLADIEGVRSNQLIGYGLVVGLNRTGDRVQQNLYARQTLQNLLEHL